MFTSLHTSRDRLASLSAPHPAGLVHRIVLAHTVWRQRQTLACLDDHTLADIGLTRDQALAEANRPIWDVPQHWRR